MRGFKGGTDNVCLKISSRPLPSKDITDKFVTGKPNDAPKHFPHVRSSFQNFYDYIIGSVPSLLFRVTRVDGI